jgi:tetratricopeptide (TPR) repeat protein
MRILLLGSNYFQKALRDLGVEAVWAGDDPDCDLRLPGPDFDLPGLLSRLDFKPEVLVLTDDLGRRVLPSGLDRIGILKAYYAVDGPINDYWQRHLATLFDLVLADQKTTTRRLAEVAPGRTHWLPVAVDTALYQGPAETRRYDISFVGTVNENVRPKRSRILKLLSRRYSTKIAGDREGGWVSSAEAATIYRQSGMVLNENLFSGVTTRMFEVMASGGMLLTEAGQDGLSDLFEIGRDLEVFSPEDLYQKIDHYLAHPDLRRRMAAGGREKVLDSHDIRNRAGRLLELLAEAVPHSGCRNPATVSSDLGQALFHMAFRWPRYQGWPRLMRAERRLETAVHHGKASARDLLFLGLISKHKGDSTRAQNRLHQAWEAGEPRAALGLAYMNLAGALADSASALFKRAAGQAGFDFPGKITNRISPDQHFVLGRMLEADGYDLTPGFSFYGLDMTLWNAFEHYRAALEADPGHVESLLALCRLLIRYGAWTECHIILQRGLEQKPSNPRLTDLAERAAVLGYADIEDIRQVA